MDLSIILVNWNSLDFLRDCLRSVYDETQGISFEIIVVDNASPEGGIEKIHDLFPDVKTIQLAENVGFAAANNAGFRSSTGEYVLLLNPDTEVVGPAIRIMLDQIRGLPDAGVVGCRLLNTDRSVQLTAIQKFPTILNQVLDIEYFQLKWPDCPLWEMGPLFDPEAKLTKVEVISGACMLLRRDVFASVGGFSEDYFMYAEDIDLNFKVHHAGHTNYYVSAATIVHHGGKSSSQQVMSYWSTIMKYRAMRRLFRKNKGPFYGFLYRASIGCVAAVRLLILGVAYPFGQIFGLTSIRAAAKKWATIFRWAVGAVNVSA